MRRGMIGTGIAAAALLGLATSAIAATVRAGDSLPTTASKRIAVRAGTAQDNNDEEGSGSGKYIAIGLGTAAVIGGAIAITQSKSP